MICSSFLGVVQVSVGINNHPHIAGWMNDGGWYRWWWGFFRCAESRVVEQRVSALHV